MDDRQLMQMEADIISLKHIVQAMTEAFKSINRQLQLLTEEVFKDEVSGM